MTSDEQGFLAAIRADRDNDVIRGAYADWLDDHDRPERAELIRVQVELAGMESLPENRAGAEYQYVIWSERMEALRKRERELLGEPGGPCRRCDWHQPLPHGGWSWEFHRGFIAAVACSASEWVRHGDDILTQHPVEVVRLTTAPTMQEVAAGDFYRERDVWGEPMLSRRWKGVRFKELPAWRLTPVRVGMVVGPGGAVRLAE